MQAHSSIPPPYFKVCNDTSCAGQVTAALVLRSRMGANVVAPPLLRARDGVVYEALDVIIRLVWDADPRYTLHFRLCLALVHVVGDVHGGRRRPWISGRIAG